MLLHLIKINNINFMRKNVSQLLLLNKALVNQLRINQYVKFSQSLSDVYLVSFSLQNVRCVS